MDVAFLTEASKKTAKLLGRKLTEAENMDLIKVVKNIDPNSEDYDTGLISNNYSKQILDQAVKINAAFSISNINDLIKEVLPENKTKKAYICLDSRYAEFSTDFKKMKWNYINTLQEGLNSTNVVGPVKNITAIRMLSFTTRKFTSAAQRASVLIEELSAQSFIFQNGRHFHFVGLINDLINPVSLDTRGLIIGAAYYIDDYTIINKVEILSGFKFSDGWYRFHKPIKALDTLTVSLGDPFNLVAFPKYEFSNVTISFVGTVATIVFEEPHQYPSIVNDWTNTFYPPPPQYDEYSLFIDGFTTDDPVADAVLIDWINKQEYTSVEIKDASTIEIRILEDLPAGVNVAPVVNVVPGLAPPVGVPSKVRVRFNSYRIIMNYEVEYLED